MNEPEKILNILQSIGCKISVKGDKIIFSDDNLVNDILLHKIETHKDSIKLLLSSEIQTMSIDIDSGGVGTELRKLLNNMSNVYDSFNRYRELDARGYLWCDSNRTMIVKWLTNFAQNYNIELSPRHANTFVKKAISNYKKSLIS